MRKLSLLFAAFFLPMLNVQAEICSSSISADSTTPTERFTISSDNRVVTDDQTKLMWARCAWGYAWDVSSSKCSLDTSDPSVLDIMTWKQALAAAKDNAKETDANFYYLGFDGWRVPNIKELASIVERKCHNPAINNEVFPGTPSTSFWSNTHVKIDGTSARVVNFNDGSVTSALKTSGILLRLVRDIN